MFSAAALSREGSVSRLMNRVRQRIAAKNFPGGRIDDHHFPRSQALALDDFLSFEGCDADFRAEDHQAVGGHRISQRTQAVAIELCAHGPSIADNERRGAVPRLLLASLRRKGSA